MPDGDGWRSVSLYSFEGKRQMWKLIREERQTTVELGHGHKGEQKRKK
jgi:hypothetical protein